MPTITILNVLQQDLGKPPFLPNSALMWPAPRLWACASVGPVVGICVQAIKRRAFMAGKIERLAAKSAFDPASRVGVDPGRAWEGKHPHRSSSRGLACGPQSQTDTR